MTELKFDTEGITDCPMEKGRATWEECEQCIYCKPYEIDGVQCIYKDIFTKEKE